MGAYNAWWEVIRMTAFDRAWDLTKEDCYWCNKDLTSEGVRQNYLMNRGTHRFPPPCPECKAIMTEGPADKLQISGQEQKDPIFTTGEPMSFDRAWVIVKAVLPDLDLGGEYQIYSQPRFGMHSEPGDMEYNFYTMPGTAMDILDDFYSDENWKSAAPYDVIGIDDRIREFERNPGIFDNPLNVAQRQNARHQGSAHPYSVFSSAMTDEDNNLVQRWLEGLEDEGAPANLAQAHVSPSGEVKNIFLNPGFGGRGIGQHMLGAILQDMGRVGDDDYSVEGYQLWNKLGSKLTDGGDLSIHDFNDLAVSDKDYAKWWKNRSIIDRVKDDFRFSRPTYDLTDNPVQGYTRRGDDEPDMHVAPNPYPYQFSKLPHYLFEGRENHPLEDRFPLEIAYTGSDPKAVTNAPRTRTTMEQLRDFNLDGFVVRGYL